MRGQSFWDVSLLTRGKLLAVKASTHLEHGGDHHGQHAQGKSQDVEEGDGGEGLFRIQNIIAIHQSVD